jgi:sigma-B regulation protein RsbU (phosphoserine phosphatase)
MLPVLDQKFGDNSVFNLYAKTAPAREVGGDFYDFFFLDPDAEPEKNKAAFVIADVSGKGVPSALFMVIAKTLIKQRLLLSPNPAECLSEVNRILCEDNPTAMFATVFILILDLSSGEAVYTSGGHPAPLISYNAGAFCFMKQNAGIPPGMFKESEYTNETIKLFPGDKIYFYTDGVIEAMNGGEIQFGKERLLRSAEKYRLCNAETFDFGIRKEINEWVSGAEQHDDITTMALCLK